MLCVGQVMLEEKEKEAEGNRPTLSLIASEISKIHICISTKVDTHNPTCVTLYLGGL
jgi:hypothetical protein